MLPELSAGKSGWPALLPVVLVSLGLVFTNTAAVARETSSAARVHRVLKSEEVRLAAAVRKRDIISLDRSAVSLGALVDTIKERDRNGISVKTCDFAAIALANVAIFVAHGLRGSKDWQEIVFNGSVDEANSFATNMNKCERELGVRPRDHGALAKNLKALSKNG